jgi:hypothetical protein
VLDGRASCGLQLKKVEHSKSEIRSWGVSQSYLENRPRPSSRVLVLEMMSSSMGVVSRRRLRAVKTSVDNHQSI